jgi:hypothetical protein
LREAWRAVDDQKWVQKIRLVILASIAAEPMVHACHHPCQQKKLFYRALRLWKVTLQERTG